MGNSFDSSKPNPDNYLSQEHTTKLEHQLQRIHEIASSSGNSRSHRSKMISSIVSSWQENYNTEPILILFPDPHHEYAFLQCTLFNNSHVCYVFNGKTGRGQAHIIHSLKHETDLPITQTQLSQDIRTNATKLNQQLKNILSNSNHPNINKEDLTNSIAKVRSLVDKTPDRLDDFVKKSVADGKCLQALDMSNKVNNYFKFANHLTDGYEGAIPIHPDILHSVTGQVLNSLKVS